MNTTDHPTSRLHRALASQVRVGMLRLLAAQPQSVSDVARASRVSVSMASRHLAILAGAGLIVRERIGSYVSHRATPAGTRALEAWTRQTTDAPTQPRDPADLTELTGDDLEFVLTHGVGAIAAGVRERDRWIDLLTQDLGPEWRDRLPTVWDAALRLCRGEPLQGLPLPPGLIADPPPQPQLRADLVAWAHQGTGPERGP